MAKTPERRKRDIQRNILERELEALVNGNDMRGVIHGLVALCHKRTDEHRKKKEFDEVERWMQLCQLLTYAESQATTHQL